MWELAKLRELRVFFILHEELHFGRTAERLRLSQTRVSQTIRELETKLGTPLFVRTSRRVAPTPAGHQLHEQASPIYEQLRHILREIHDANREIEGELRLGLDGPSAGGQALPSIISLFTARHPDCSVQVSETGIADPTRSASPRRLRPRRARPPRRPTRPRHRTHPSPRRPPNRGRDQPPARQPRKGQPRRHRRLRDPRRRGEPPPRKAPRLAPAAHPERPTDPPPPSPQPALHPDLCPRHGRRDRPLRLNPPLPDVPRRPLPPDHRHAPDRIRPHLACQRRDPR